MYTINSKKYNNTNIVIRDIHKTLELFAKDSPMDYCDIFNEIKSVLEYIDKNVKKLSKIVFKGGNESYINDLELRLQNIFVEHELLEEGEDDLKIVPKNMPMLRKVTLFLFFNSDCTYKFNLKDDSESAHVFEICPLMPKFLLMTVIWDLRLDPCLYEILSYMPCWFSFLHYEKAIETLKYEEDPFKVLEKIHRLIDSLLINQARSNSRQLDVVDKKIIYNKLYDQLTCLLRPFNTPDSNKLEGFSEKKQAIYMGYVFQHLLEIILLAFDLFEKPNKANESKDEMEIYNLFKAFNKPIEPPLEALTSELKSQELQCIVALLNALQTQVFQTSINTFVHWHEKQVTEDQTLQEMVGELAYYVLERLQNNQQFSHNLANQLVQFALKPKSLEEQIANASLGDKLRNLDKPLPDEDKKAWLDAILKDSSSLGNDECLETLKEYSRLMGPEQIRLIMEDIKMKNEHILSLIKRKQNVEEGKEIEEGLDAEYYEEAIETAEENVEKLLDLIKEALVHFTENDLIEILKIQVELFGQDSMVFRSPEFELKANEFFNKMVDEFNEKEFLMICFESPAAMFDKFFHYACLNEKQNDIFLSLMEQTIDFSFKYLNEIMPRACKDPEIVGFKNFPKLLANIYAKLYFPRNHIEFLKKQICDNVMTYMEDNQFELVQQMILFCSLVCSIRNDPKTLPFGEGTAPVMLVAAKAMEGARWDITNFSEAKSRLVNECLSFIKKLSESFLPLATKKDRAWITKNVNEYSQSTKYYFQQFMLPAQEEVVDFPTFMGVDKAEDPIMFLIHNFSRSTAEEAKYLACHNQLTPYLSEMMQMFGEYIQKNKTFATLANYRHCLSNYIEIVQTVLLPDLENDPRKIERLLIKFLRIINAAPSDIYEECLLQAESILEALMQKLEKPLSETAVSNIGKQFSSLPDCKVKEVLQEKFENISKEQNVLTQNTNNILY